MISPNAPGLRVWLVSRLASTCALDPQSIDARERFTRYGLDSLGAIRLITALAAHLGRPLSPTLVFEHPTIEALASHLAGERTSSASTEEPTQGYDAQEPIAIVGLACRFPGAPDVASFWRLLRDRVDAVSEVPADRGWDELLLARGVDPAEREKVRRGAFLDRLDTFDPLFFGISPREAMAMDPQQRLMLELCWESLEDAGIRPSSLRGTQTGVFAGAIWSDYGALLYRGTPDGLGQFSCTGVHHSIIANRISYVFGLEGPSLTLDSACSSGLVVVHLACDSLRRGESRVALAGAVNLNVLPESALAVSRFGALSPDGRCFTFDARANGYVRGEGGGVLVLKTLSRAVADGDPIHAVIRGSAVNNDGASNGLTAPSRSAQEAVLRAAYRRAGVRPDAVQYVEAHGTGTPLGDPIEARALGAVLGVGRPADAPLLIGSAKTNVGHLEGAAGIVGLVKVALAIEHRLLPASLHFASPNPHAPLAELGLAVPTAARPWPAPERLLTAGVSSFGLGGTNGHVVLQEWPAPMADVLPLAAESPSALRLQVEALRASLAPPAGAGSLSTGPQADPDLEPRWSPLPLRELCAEAASRCGRAASRLAVVAHSHAELDTALATFLEGHAGATLHASAEGPDASRGVVFVFPGQGAQWHGMARTLLQSEPVFRATLAACDQHIHRYMGWSLLDELTAPRAASRLDSIEVSLPAIISIDIAVAAWWRSLGIEPAAVVGHSTGEIAAAHVAGALDLDDTMRIICAYGRFVGRFAEQGGMAFVGLPWDEAAGVLAGFEGRVFRAIQDSAEGTVVAGEPDALAALLDGLQARGVFCRHVKMNVAPHSPLVDSVRGELFQALQGIRPRRGSVPLISEVTGAEMDGQALDAAHWVRNFGDPALFSSAVDALVGRGHRVFLDVGPHPITRHSVETNLRRAGAAGVVLSSLRRDEDERGALRDTLAAFHALGFPVRWDELYPMGNDTITAGADAWLLPLSARSPEALVSLASAYAERLRPGASRTRLRDIVYTAGVRQEHHPHRLAVVGRSREELAAELSAFARGDAAGWAAHGQTSPSGPPKVVFVFPGQGSQWLGMGQKLLAEEPVFRSALSACDQAIQAEAGWSLFAELAADEASSQLGRIDVVQPALFAFAVALAALWRSWGVEPDAVVGHSMGEVAAAHVAGVLSLSDATKVICRRSKLLRRVSGRGAMALVELTLPESEAALAGYADRLSVAVNNGPRSTVISGDPAALEEVLAALDAKGVFCRRVKVDVASHSPQMDPLLEELRSVLNDVQPGSGRITMRSTVTGAMVAGPELDAAYWADNLRAPVLFSGAIQQVIAEGHTIFLELSPHPILLPAVEENLREQKQEGTILGSVRRSSDERRSMLEALGALWARGIDVAWERRFPAGGRVVSLPMVPWQRERYWLEAPAGDSKGSRGRVHGGGHPLLGEAHTVSTQAGMRLWETTLDLERLPWLADHRVQGAVVFPGAAYLEMALAAGAEAFDGSSLVVSDVVFVEALVFASDAAVQVQVVTTEEQPGRLRFQIASGVPDAGGVSWTAHARGLLRRAERAEAPAKRDMAGVRARLGAAEPAGTVYAALSEAGLDYGPAFQGIAELWRGEGEALGRVRLPEPAGAALAYRIHPALLDACFQGMIGAFSADEKSTWMPVEMRSLRLLQRPVGELWCHVRLVPHGQQAPGSMTPNRRSADLLVVDGTGELVAEVSGLMVQQVASSPRRHEQDDWFLELAWEPAAAPASKVRSGRFLLLGDGGGLGAALRAALEASGHTVIHAVAGAPGKVPDGCWPVDDTSAAGVRALLGDAFGGQAPTALVHLRSLEGDCAIEAGAIEADTIEADMIESDTIEADTIEAALVRGCDSVLFMVQALAGMGWRNAPRLWLVTRGAQAVGDGDVAVNQAPLLGLGRVIALEHPELSCARVDLDPARPEGEISALLAEIVADEVEPEIALRDGARRVARIVHRPPETARPERIEPAGGRPFRLVIDKPGVLDDLSLRVAERRPPSPGEVEIAVEAAGLNFLDVLLALGVMPNDVPGETAGPMGLGGECAGRIVAVGEGVSGLAVGQPVLALARGAFASHVIVPAALVLPRPAGLSAPEAAAFPVAYLTAWYALSRVARLQQGERVLIHAATGGVGLAAVQWAQHVGAEVYATAGTPEKRAYLESLGVRHVSDSRSDRFVSDVHAWTGGEGVDVVLNSLSGELIAKSFDLLRSHGRFVELGKRDYYADNPLGLRPFLRNLSFSLVDLRGMLIERPAQVRALFEELLGLVASGVFTPPPVETLPISRAADAFRKMAQAQHVGKLVLTVDEPEVQIRARAESDVAVRRDGSYLVTGGLGGLGLSVAGWLAGKGAGHLILVGRSRAASAEQKAAIAAIEAKGARVTVAKADVADRDQMARVLDAISASGTPLRGVIHAAGLLDDGLLAQQTSARFRKVMAPKIDGALHLHALTRAMPLDFFVLYASGAGLLGSPGQGNYAAANTFLDALSHHRRGEGLPALSIDWGAFSEVGLAAAQENRGARLVSRGMRSLTPDEGLAVLARLLDGDRAQVGVLPLDVRQWVEFYPAAAASRMLSRLLAVQPSAAGRAAGERDLLARLAAAEPAERAALMQEALCAQISQVLRIPESKLAVDAPLTSLGMDSLMGLELRNRLEARFGVRLSAASLWQHPTIATLKELLLDARLRAALKVEPRSSLPSSTVEEREEGTL